MSKGVTDVRLGKKSSIIKASGKGRFSISKVRWNFKEFYSLSEMENSKDKNNVSV